MTILAVDTETTGTDFWHGCKPFMISMFDGRNGEIWEGEVDGNTREVSYLPDIILGVQQRLDDAKTLVFHNTNFDMKALSTIGIRTEHLWSKIEDTLIASHVICSSDSHGLKDLGIKYLRYSDNDEAELQAAVVQARLDNPNWAAKKGHKHFPAIKTAKWWKMDLWLEPELCRKYAGGDAIRTWRLWKIFKDGLIKDNMYHVYERRRDLLPIVYRMREVGINFYKDKAKELYYHLDEQREQLRVLIQETSKANVDIFPNKSASLSHLLYNVLNLDVIKRTKSGKPATDSKTLDRLLEGIETETVKYIKAWRLVDKKRSSVISYLKWEKDNRLHSTVNITGTHWTRQSSSDPNQQNFDKQMMELFGPPPGKYWLYVDIVNIELRIWAYDVGAKSLIEAFERGESVHIIIAKALYPELIEELGIAAFKETKVYTNCKSGTFAKLFGGGKHKVDSTYGVKDAEGVIAAKLPEVAAYFRQLDAKMKKLTEIWGYPCIFTKQGYRLEVPISKPHTVTSARIQGTAGEIIQDMMREISRDPYYQVREIEMNQQVHDSLNFEIDDHPEEELTNKYIVNKLEEIGCRHIPTCPLDYAVIRPKTGVLKLIDYKYTTKSIGNYSVILYKKKVQPIVNTALSKSDKYHWFMDIRNKSNKKDIHTFEAEWRNQVIDKATQFIESAQ